MNYRFIYDNGNGCLVDEQGFPVVNDVDMSNLLSLEPSLDLTEQRDMARNGNYVYNSTDKHSKKKSSLKDESSPLSESSRRTYSIEDRENFFDIWIDKPGVSISSIASELGIQARTAQRWVKDYKENNDGEIPFPRSKGRKTKPKLNEEHKDFLHTLIDENPSVGLDDMIDGLSDSFKGLKVSKTTLYRFSKEECVYSFELARAESVERNFEETIQKRYEFVSGLQNSDVQYSRNCVFIDEASFNVNMKRTGKWSAKGTTPVVKTHSIRTENRTILGAICYHGVVLLSLKKPGSLVQNKNLEVEGSSSEEWPIGAATGHFKQFLIYVMDVLDQHPLLKNAYLVMDDASIHKNPSIGRIIASRNYKYIHLPPFSPELNPIEQFWHLMERRIKREKLLEKETLTSRITEAAKSIPIEHIQNCIHHSQDSFSECLNREDL